MENSAVNSYNEMIINTTACKGLRLIGENYSGALVFEKESFEFVKYHISIVRTQWSKTQGAWSIKVDNFFPEKRHELKLPFDNLKQCKEAISMLKEKGSFHHWTGYVVESGMFIK